MQLYTNGQNVQPRSSFLRLQCLCLVKKWGLDGVTNAIFRLTNNIIRLIEKNRHFHFYYFIFEKMVAADKSCGVYDWIFRWFWLYSIFTIG